jgi:hypothetical protein
MKLLRYICCLFVSCLIIMIGFAHGPLFQRQAKLYADVFSVGQSKLYNLVRSKYAGEGKVTAQVVVNGLPMRVETTEHNESPAELLEKIKNEYNGKIISTPDSRWGLAAYTKNGQIHSFVAFQNSPNSITTLGHCTMDSAFLWNGLGDLFAEKGGQNDRDLEQVPVLSGARYTLKLEQQIGNQKFCLYNFFVPVHPRFVEQFYKTQFEQGGWNTIGQEHEKDTGYLQYSKNNEECYFTIDANTAQNGCHYTVALLRTMEGGDACQ